MTKHFDSALNDPFFTVFAVFCSYFFMFLVGFSIFVLCNRLVFLVLQHFCSICSFFVFFQRTGLRITIKISGRFFTSFRMTSSFLEIWIPRFALNDEAFRLRSMTHFLQFLQLFCVFSKIWVQNYD